MRTGVIERLTSLPVSPRWSIRMSQTRVAVPPAGVEDHSATRVYVGVIVHLRGMTGHSSFAGRREIGLPDSPIDGIVPFWPTSSSFRPSDAMMPVLLFMPAE